MNNNCIKRKGVRTGYLSPGSLAITYTYERQIKEIQD